MTEFLIKNILSEELFENRICESLDDQAIVNYLYEELLLDRLLYGQPITVPELRALLHKKILNFQFIKLNGEIRDRGTWSLGLYGNSGILYRFCTKINGKWQMTKPLPLDTRAPLFYNPNSQFSWGRSPYHTLEVSENLFENVEYIK